MGHSLSTSASGQPRSPRFLESFLCLPAQSVKWRPQALNPSDLSTALSSGGVALVLYPLRGCTPTLLASCPGAVLLRCPVWAVLLPIRSRECPWESGKEVWVSTELAGAVTLFISSLNPQYSAWLSVTVCQVNYTSCLDYRRKCSDTHAGYSSVPERKGSCQPWTPRSVRPAGSLPAWRGGQTSLHSALGAGLPPAALTLLATRDPLSMRNPLKR